MLTSIRTQKQAAAATVLVAMMFIFSQALWAMGPARLLPQGKVRVYRGDQLVSVLSQEAPLPEGALLAPEGQCGLRMDNLYLVADDGSQFSIATTNGGRDLLVRQGTVFFAMSGLTGPMVFHTPGGAITTERMILNASAEGGLLKGYVDAAPDGTHIGVLEGGRLVVMTPDGERTINAGRQVTLAQADLFEEDPTPGADGQGQGNDVQGEDPQGPEDDARADAEDPAGEEDDDDEIPATYFWAGGGILAAAGIAAAVGGGGGGGGGGSSAASPAAP